jgi:hypothetical protein
MFFFLINRLPKNFDFSRDYKTKYQIVKYRSKPLDPEEFNQTYPMKVSSHQSGFRSNIKFATKHISGQGRPSLDQNHHKTHVFEGCRYFIHSPYDMLSKSSKSYQSLVDFRILFFLNPQQTKIDDTVVAYPPQRRGCYLPEEKTLKFFKKFSKENCQSECLANKTLEVCGCVQFFMVREISTRICGINEIKCYQKVEDDVSKLNTCQCLLLCEEVVYKVDAKRMEFVLYD